MDRHADRLAWAVFDSSKPPFSDLLLRQASSS